MVRPDAVLADRAEVTALTGGWVVVERVDATSIDHPYWLRPWQAPNAKVGDRGKLVYRVINGAGLFYFLKEDAQ